MNKLITKSAAMMIYASSVFAYSSSNNLTGFYLGLLGGKEFAKIKHVSDKQFLINLVDGPDSKKVNYINDHAESIKFNGLFGGIHLGYQYDFGRYIAGFEYSFTKHSTGKNINYSDKYRSEVDGQAVDATDAEKSFSRNLKIKHKNAHELGLRLGYKIMPQWIVGVKLGYALNSYDIKISDRSEGSFSEGPTMVPLNRVENLKRKVNFNSFVPGVYVEKFINAHVMIGGEYSWTINKKRSISADSADITVSNGELEMKRKFNSSFRPRTQNFKIRLGYKF